MPGITLANLGGMSIDLTPYMRKDVYDPNNDGVVDKINKLTNISELATGYTDGQVPKVNMSGNSDWAKDETGSLDVVDGGFWN